MRVIRTLDLPTGMSIRFGCVPPAPARATPEADDDADKPTEAATPPPRPSYPR